MTPRVKVWMQSLFVAAATLAMSSAVRAAEEGGNSAEGPLGHIFKWIHFAILAVLALWLFGKVLPSWFRGNADKISSAINKANAAKAEAERKLQEATAKLANLEKEIAEFRRVSEREAAAEVERLKALTAADAQKIRAAAGAEAEAAEHAARVELKALAAKLAIDGAEKQVAEQMTPSIQEVMINNFVQSLQGRPN
jgi:F0F1-type ATP synthase membrane subunit b/b'